MEKWKVLSKTNKMKNETKSAVAEAFEKVLQLHPEIPTQTITEIFSAGVIAKADDDQIILVEAQMAASEEK